MVGIFLKEELKRESDQLVDKRVFVDRNYALIEKKIQKEDGK